MKKHILWSLCAVAVAGLVCIGAWHVVRDSGDTRQEGEAYRAVKRNEAAHDKSSRKPIAARKRPKGARIAAAEQIRPDLKLEAAEAAMLTEQMREIYRSLQDALDKGDRKRVFALIHRLQSMDEWPDGIPNSVKKRALSALAWFGAAGIAEAVGFLADSSQEIRDAAVETFKQQLADNWDLGDKVLSQTLTSMAKVVTDADALETFYEQLGNMRPSVRAATVAEIYKSGTDSAKQVLDQNLESVFMMDETSVTTREDVDKALKAAQEEAPEGSERDKEYDDEYGPSNWNW